ncbi:flagellar basal body L-ring protein FlgH [Arenimonas terrae]|uniref:Flagellar basal body L-ring protein FlgH n=1 Tax=Arenimonas terrae TaxID=2546226 RepID=A0A5C4RQ08_9GAMM|nr:flagellar basal body L-ring protein FlgH [Arenimonas terrae]TNJ33240.1 flagellar basal body L-ring protein FlgH [Arenimonas terrae]
MFGLVLGVTALTAHASVSAQETLVDVASYRGLAADHRANRPGDILTILVQEATRAKSQAATDAGSQVDIAADLTTPHDRYDAGVGFGGRSNAGAQTTRMGELRTQVSARVVSVANNGDLQIEGDQVLVVNGERQQIRISGLVRVQDISSDNAVLSTRIANANLELVGVGVVSESQRKSILYKVFQWLRLL